jgi:3-oxoacyl-[acyl-carrier-protein] synthase III
VTSASVPSPAQTRRGLALSTIAGIGINRPPAGAPLARRVSGTDVTGVSYRVQAESGVTTASLAAGAARAALQAAGVGPADIEMIIVGTTSPDVLWPSTACLVQTELKLPMVASFDLYAAETSLLAALNVATHYVSAGTRGLLVIGAESDNQLVDLPGQGGAVRGRAAAAVVLTGAAGDAGILSTVVGGAAQPDLNGDTQDRILLRGLAEGVDECLRKAGLSMTDIDLVVGEQSAPEIMEAWRKSVRLPGGRLLVEPARYGALLAAAPLIALHDAVRGGRLRDGMAVLLLQCGSGPVWGVACVRWGKGGLVEC